MDFAIAISYVALDGKEERLDSPEIAYDFYSVLAFGGRTSLLMPLQKKYTRNYRSWSRKS